MKIQRRIRALSNSQRLRGFLSLSGATLFSQIITLAALPFLSRLYSPEDFGVLSLVLAISAIVSPALALKFDAAALLPKSRRQTRAVVTMGALAVLIVSSLWALFADLIASAIFKEQPIPFLGLWVWATTLLTGIFALFSQLAVRDRRYRAVATRTLYQSVASTGSQLAFGALRWAPAGLLTGTLIGKLVGLVGLVIVGRRYVGGHRLRDSFQAWREYWRFPLIFAPSSILNSLGIQLPLIILTAQYGIEFGGQLGMAERIVAVPISIVGAAVSQIFLGDLAEMRRRGNHAYSRLFMRLSGALATISILGLGSLALLADQLIPLILGANWTTAASLIKILAITGIVRLIATPLSGAFSIFQRARANILIDTIRISLMTLSILSVFYFPLSPEGAAWILYGSLSIVYVITWAYVFFLLRGMSGRGAEGESLRLRV